MASIKPFPQPPTEEPTIETVEFPGTSERDLNPFTTFVNHLFLYPQSLSFESQKLFSRARNIAVLVELRCGDGDDAKPIEVFDIIMNILEKLFIYVCIFSAFMDVLDKRC